MIAKIAYRNIRQHQTKTLIIGLLVTLGITVLVVGNSLMDTAARGIERAYIDSYTGHVVITGFHRGGLSLTGFETADAFDRPVPTIPQFETVLEYVASRPYVKAVNPQATAMAIVDFGEKRSFTQFFGIDPAYYERMFPDNIELVSGRMLASGEEGILLSAYVATQLERNTDRKIAPGDTVLLTGMNQTTGVRVREVPVRGIFRFKQSNPALDYVSIMDITNVRALAGMNVSAVSTAELSELEAALLGIADEDALFGGDIETLFGGQPLLRVVDEESAGDSPSGAEGAPMGGTVGPASSSGGADAVFPGGLDDLFFSGALIREVETSGDASGSEAGVASDGSAGALSGGGASGGAVDEETLLARLGLGERTEAVFFDDSNSWHFLLVKLEDGASIAAALADFERFFEENGIDAMASNWLAGAGSIALLANGTKRIFNVVVLIIAVVAVIIIMNTLVISVTERTVEIGTMRALGAQKSFIRRMIAWETALTSGIFGLIGIILGLIVIMILSATGIEAPNVFFEVLFGGKVLHPRPSLGSILTSLVVVVVIGVVSSLYPVSIALKTKPAQAMQE